MTKQFIAHAHLKVLPTQNLSNDYNKNNSTMQCIIKYFYLKLIKTRVVELQNKIKRTFSTTKTLIKEGKWH